MFKWKENDGCTTSDFWYDLTCGGYIDPDVLLEEEDAKRVNEAIDLVLRFQNEGIKNGHLEIM